MQFIWQAWLSYIASILIRWNVGEFPLGTYASHFLDMKRRPHKKQKNRSFDAAIISFRSHKIITQNARRWAFHNAYYTFWNSSQELYWFFALLNNSLNSEPCELWTMWTLNPFKNQGPNKMTISFISFGWYFPEYVRTPFSFHSAAGHACFQWQCWQSQYSRHGHNRALSTDAK